MSSPLTVTIGTTYLIDVNSTNNTHGWIYTLENAYASGSAIWGLYPVAGGYDYCFHTYASLVGQPPAITSASSIAFTEGKAGSFTVTTTGYPVPVLSFSGDLPSGVTFTDNGNGTASLSGTPATGTEGTYSLTFTATSTEGDPAVQSFTLTVTAPPPVAAPPSVTIQPQNQTRKVGETAIFNASATGFPTPTVQWQLCTNGKKWKNIKGATSTTYETDPVTLKTNNYQYRAVFSNPSGSVTTSPATLTVTTGTADVGVTKTGVYNAKTKSITWTITVINNGPDTAQGVKVIDTLAKFTKLLQVSGGYTYKAQGTKVTINIGTIEASDSVKIITVESLVKRAASPVENTVTVTTTSVDNNSANNTATGSVIIP